MKSLRLLFVLFVLQGWMVMSSDEIRESDLARIGAESTKAQATILATSASLLLVPCSYVLDHVLASFESTAKLPNRRGVATIACASMYGAFAASVTFCLQDPKK
jgi:hypothetical protein